jgi:uncharacterized membrane protein SpoIIM required for sporulation
MREGQFINKYKDRWAAYQAEPTDDPDLLAKRFAGLVDDLAFARTFYKGSNTTRYINGMAAEIYLKIYRTRSSRKNRLLSFWYTELPLILYRYRRVLYLSFALFIAFFMLGVVSSMQEPDFSRAILGDEYVDMTLENIAKGDPFGVYKGGDSFVMFLKIAWNNIRVSLLMFGLGISWGVGTFWILFKNALMVGVFEHLFYSHHLGKDFFLVVFIHGTLELSAIVIAATSGFIIAQALIFPGTFSRIIALRKSALDAVKINLSQIPVLLIAAFFESYLTRHTEMPLALSLLILGASLGLIVGYFLIYPVLVFRREQKSFREAQK